MAEAAAAADTCAPCARRPAGGSAPPATLRELSEENEEEEDVFPERAARGAARRSADGRQVCAAEASGHLEDEFLHLAIRKQVSYRPR